MSRVPAVIEGSTALAMLRPDAPLATEGQILDLARYLRTLVTEGQSVPECPVVHEFAHNIYSRKVVMPVGSLIVSKRHRFDHFAVVILGNVDVWEPGQPRKNRGDGDHFLTRAGMMRALYCHEETTWITYHGTDKTTVEEVEAEIIIPEDYYEGDKP